MSEIHVWVQGALHSCPDETERNSTKYRLESHFFGFPLSFSSDSVLKFNSP